VTAFAQPLDRFPLVRTRSVEEMLAALARIYAKPAWRFEGKGDTVDVALNYRPLTHIGLGYTKYGDDMSGRYPESGVSLQTVPIRGRGEATFRGIANPLGVGRGLTVSAGRSFATNLDRDYEHLLVLMNPHALTEKLKVITGRDIDRAPEFEPIMDHANPAAKALRNHVLFLVNALSEQGVPLPKVLLDEFEQMLLVMILYANRHNHSHLLERAALDIAPWQVRRAEEYIESHWRQPITLEDLAEATGVSALDLFRSFKKSRGYSPMEFANRVRLNRARELLQSAGGLTLVASIASICGFADLRRFKKEYILAFGETPAATLGPVRDGNPQLM
jgi:AraC-like DNA-binding protein